MRRAFLDSVSSPLKLSIVLIAMTGLAAACSGKNNSDDDDDGGDGGNSGDSGSPKGGTSGNSSGGTGTAPKGGSSGSGGGSTFAGDCSDVCDRSAACPDFDPASCTSACSALNAFVTANVCKAEIEGLFDCGSNTEDLCSGADVTCPTEADAYQTCLVDYCTNNGSSSLCQGLLQ